jgi:titin
MRIFLFVSAFVCSLLGDFSFRSIFHVHSALATRGSFFLAPAAPSHLTVNTVSHKRIDLSWSDNSSDEAGFKIERKIPQGGTGVFAEIAALGANVESYVDSSLAASTEYFYRVRAHNADGASGFTNEANATTFSAPLMAPSNLTAQAASPTRITLAWADNSSSETGFKIERKLSAAANYTLIATTGANVTSFVDTGLVDNTKYFYRLRAFNSDGHSPYSTAVSATTPPMPPNPPSALLAAAVGSDRINLSWKDNSGSENGFKIERKINGGAYTLIDAVGANVTAYSNAGLNSNTKYFYRVRAHNSAGHSEYSNEAEATTLPTPPAAPDNLTAAAASNKQINLAWLDNASNEDGFKIERKVGSTGSYAEVATLNANVTSYADNNLAANTAYFYRLRAFNAGGQSNYSGEASATTLPNAPAAAGNLIATTISKSQINLAWQDKSNNEDGFTIERKIGSAGAFAPIATIGANMKNYSDNNLDANTAYFYRVRAFNAGGQSAYSNEANATTLLNPPAAPGSLSALPASYKQINLTWTDSSNDEAGFRIERKLSTATTYTLIATVDANATSFADTSLEASTKYFYRLRAYNAGGHSPYSTAVSATTLPYPPAAPSNLTATALSQTQINLAWDDKATSEEGFKIERRIGSSSKYVEVAALAANAKNYPDNGLSPNTTYFYRLRAFNAGGSSDYANEASATTLPNPPARPGNLTATAMSNQQINLAWSDSANNEIGFKVERKFSGGVYAQIASLDANARNFADKNLLANTEYFYRLRAYNAGGLSSYSNEASATTLPNPPVAPGNLKATTINQRRINLTWTDNSSDEIGFKIERRLSAETIFTNLATVEANVTSFADTSLAADTKYFYRIRAYNTGGHSSYSTAVSATTPPFPPAAPSDLTATPVSNVQINLAWQDQAINETGFTIERKSESEETYTEIVPRGGIGANVRSYSNSGLSPNTKYFYRVRAFNAGGQSEYSNEASATTLPNRPAAPSHLIAATVSQTQIDLAWQEQALNEEGFKLERKTGNTGDFAEIAKLDANVTNYSDQTLAENTLYFYRLRAFNAGGHSDYSNEASAKTLPEPPAPPGNLIATTVSNTQINLAWQDKATNEDSFKLERKMGAAGAYAAIAMLDANATNYKDHNLAANTLYFYRLRAFNAGGHSNYSNEASATTFPNPPAAPLNLTATPVNHTRINLAWTDSSDNEAGFKLERKPGSAGVYAQIAKLEANVTSYADNNLAGNTTYFYRVRAFNAGGHSNYANEASATTPPSPPATPMNLTAITISRSQINIAWQDKSANEDSFKIERKTGAEGVFAEIAKLRPNVTGYADNNLAGNTTYFYRMRALNAGGYSNYSNEASATTLPNPPAPPSHLIATAVSNQRINLAWKDSADNEVGLNIERRLSTAINYINLATVGANVTSFADTALAADTKYFYRLRAYNSGGHSGYSNETSATTLPNPPATPSNLIVTSASNVQIEVAWLDKSNNEAGFKIERKTGQAGTFAEIGAVEANVTSHASGDLNPNTKYFFRVRAYNAGGASAYSNILETATLPDRPAAPSHLTATTVNSARINLAWLDNATNEDSFKIERKAATVGMESAGAYAQVAQVSANVTRYSDTNLAGNVAYFYRVRAYNAGGFSDYANEASATTPPSPPAAPGNLTATTVSNTQINLAWQDNSTNEDSFRIERKSGAAGAFALVTKLGANVTNYSDNKLKGNTAYFYRVRALNGGGQSSYSNEATAKTLPNPPAAPSHLTAVTLSKSQITLMWQDNATNEDSFKIERKMGAAGSYAQIAKAGANATKYADAGLEQNTQYFYRVHAYNAGGYSNYTNEASATTLPTTSNAPRLLTATTIASSHIDLAWADSSNNEAGFKIERKTGTSGAFAEIAAVGANVTSYADTDLLPNTKYFYRVRAHNLSGFSSYSNVAAATTLPVPPAAPIDLTAAAMPNLQIELTWRDQAANEDSFVVERKLGASGMYAPIVKRGRNATGYLDTGLSPLTEYFYRVRASNFGGYSEYSNEARATTRNNPPAAPSNLTAATISQHQIDLAWTDNNNDEKGFVIERKAVEGAFAKIATVGANATKYADKFLAQTSAYFYRVRAFNDNGQSAYSNEATATTLSNPPAPPGSLTAVPMSNTKIRLAWTDSSDNETGFRIVRKNSAGGAFVEIATLGENVKSFVDSSLAPLTTYYYRIRAFNSGGNSSYSNETHATTFPNPPNAPGNLTAAAASSKGINLAWADQSNNETGFKIERKIGANGTFAEISVVGANVTSFADAGLSQLTEYFYRVRAFNSGGNSDYSNAASATTLPNPPVAPRGLVAIPVSYRKANLLWADNSDNEAGFKIERRFSNLAYQEIAVIGANVTSYADSSLTGNTTYFYRMRAFNSGGHSSYSAEATATTLPNPPAAPDSLTATAVSHSKINLKWKDNANDETGFRIERKISAAGTYKQIATVGANTKSFFDTNLFTNTVYFYRVRALNTGGYSDFSNEANTVTLPRPPGNLIAATISRHRIDLAWADSSNNENGFKIERRLADSAYAEIASVDANVKSFADSSLAVNTVYFYRIRAFNTGGHSSYTTETNERTLPFPPAAPRNLTATPVSFRQINLVWADSSDNEIGFKIERRPVGGPFEEVGIVIANENSFADTSLSKETTYFYRVRAFNAGGPSSYSNPASAKTLRLPPSPPSHLTATVAGSGRINLAWVDNANDEDGFRIESKNGEVGVYTEIVPPGGIGANVTSYSHAGLTEGVTYFYRVCAFNAGGCSAYSNEAEATPSADANFALNKPARASSTDTSSAAHHAVDGNLTTYWRSGTINVATPFAWLRVELSAGAAVAIGRAVIRWHQTYFANEYDIQVSLDGASWTTIYSTSAGAVGEQEVSFTPTPARYARLYMRRNNKSSYRLSEFEVYDDLTKASSAVKNEAMIPETITLAQNYPNPFGRSPFNPTTTITYSLPAATNVTLHVINLNGQIVATLANGYRERGIYHVKFDASLLPSGVYFSALQAGEVKQVRRMIVTK